MQRALTTAEIEITCAKMLRAKRRVGVRDVMDELRRRYGACGRTARVSKILRLTEAQLHVESGNEGEPKLQWEVLALHAQIERLSHELDSMTKRAAVAEAREQAHQDFWANRYAERVAELERQQMELAKTRPGVSPEQYLRVYQRAAELWRRLAEYEPAVETLFPPAAR